MKKPGDEMKSLRGDASQAEFGAKFGASQAQVSRLENGGCPTLAQAIAIRKQLGIAVEVWPWDGAMATFLRERRRVG